MDNRFFERPVLNSPYDYPARHWELDADGQPTQKIIENRRSAEFITPIPKPKKRKGSAAQQQMHFEDEAGLSTEEQQYETMERYTRYLASTRNDQGLVKPGLGDWYDWTPEKGHVGASQLTPAELPATAFLYDNALKIGRASCRERV